MRKRLHYSILALFISLLFNTFIHSQDRFAYAITDINPTAGSWTVLRKLNLQTGTYSDALLNGLDTKLAAYDAISKRQIDATLSNTASLAFGTGVAAIAYDKKDSRIYFTPMYIDQLRYIDLKTMKVYYVADQSFGGQPNKNNDDGRVVSRMVIAPDGYGYAITNDANSLIRFSTGKQLIIEQLGTLVDDPGNTGISIHNRCSSWGGDMVADDAGNLFLVSAANSVFKVNIDSKVASWLGPIKGLPQGFTVNGLVVTDDGNLLAGSQVFSKNWVVIDPKSWTASEFKTPNGVYLTSDLANSNYLSTHKKTTEITTIPGLGLPLSDIIQIYPNPMSITENQFKVQFNKLDAGNFKIELTDVTGKQVMMQKINVVSKGQIQNINLKKNTAQGIYLVTVTDINSKAVFTQKLVVQ